MEHVAIRNVVQTPTAAVEYRKKTRQFRNWLSLAHGVLMCALESSAAVGAAEMVSRLA